jgi:hypothetical protein
MTLRGDLMMFACRVSRLVPIRRHRGCSRLRVSLPMGNWYRVDRELVNTSHRQRTTGDPGQGWGVCRGSRGQVEWVEGPDSLHEGQGPETLNTWLQSLLTKLERMEFGRAYDTHSGDHTGGTEAVVESWPPRDRRYLRLSESPSGGIPGRVVDG